MIDNCNIMRYSTCIFHKRSIVLKRKASEKLDKWLANGARMTQTVSDMVKKARKNA